VRFDEMLRNRCRLRREQKRRRLQQDMVAEESGSARRARGFKNDSKLILDGVHGLVGGGLDLPPSSALRFEVAHARFPAFAFEDRRADLFRPGPLRRAPRCCAASARFAFDDEGDDGAFFG
jgi:hypothetical protein